MTRKITKDTVKGIITIIQKDMLEHHDLWGASRAVLEQLEGVVAPKILVDLREATIKIEDWEKREFAEAHRFCEKGTRIAALIQVNDPHYKEFMRFETFFTIKGVKVRVFDNEHLAEKWLLEAGD